MNFSLTRCICEKMLIFIALALGFEYINVLLMEVALLTTQHYLRHVALCVRFAFFRSHHPCEATRRAAINLIKILLMAARDFEWVCTHAMSMIEVNCRD